MAQANTTVDIVHEIATILDTGLGKEEVAIIIALIENGVNPQASLSAERSLLLGSDASLPLSHECMDVEGVRDPVDVHTTEERSKAAIPGGATLLHECMLSAVVRMLIGAG